MQVPFNTASSIDPDADSVASARQGSFEAFEQLLARHERAIYGLAMRIGRRSEDAEDVLQQTFLSVMEHLDQFAGETRFRTWVLKIAANHALKILRKRRGLPTPPISAVENDDDGPLPHPQFIAPWRDDPTVIAQREETRHLITQALDELDDNYRVVFILRDVEELSTADTAEALGISVGNVKVRLLRARLMLRERLTAVLGDSGRQVRAGHDAAEHPGAKS